MFYRQHFSWSLCSRQRPPWKEIPCYFCHSPSPMGQAFGQYGDLPFWWLCSENAGGGERRALHWVPAWSDEPDALKQNHCWLASFPCSSLCLQFGTGRGFFCQQSPPKGVFLLLNRPQKQKCCLFSHFFSFKQPCLLFGRNPGNLWYVVLGLNNRIWLWGRILRGYSY